MTPYIPHTEADVKAMLEKAGLGSLRELYSDVPQEFILGRELSLPDAKSEHEIREWFSALASMNPRLKVFAGQGAYDHYTPAVIPAITSRSEFLTAYTPYQCEISQGTLRYIFEYQSLICSLTGLDVSNASLYDGPTAAAEAMMMCLASTKKKSRVLVSGTLLPQVLDVLETYARYHGVEITVLGPGDGETSLASVEAELLAGDVAGVILPQINRYGIVENLSGVAGCVHAAGALLVLYSDPSSLAVIKSPAEWGADIAVGEAQSLGIPLSFGGPYLGFMAVKKDYMRKMPGRIVGQTVDRSGKRSFVLTLQAREQHIRREKATSNICSNESLMALWVTVYLSLMGEEGLKKVNEISASGAHYLHDALLSSGLFKEPFPGKPFLKEFVLEPLCESVESLHQRLKDEGFFTAVPDGKYVSFCVTEKRSKEETDALIAAIMKEAVK